jgi:hypothetical protein
MRGERCLTKCSFCMRLLSFSDALVFTFVDLYIYIHALYTLEAPSRALPQHQAHRNPWGLHIKQGLAALALLD